MKPPDDVADWDPAENEREYFKHRQSGQLGWLVKREGKEAVRLDRPMQDITIPYSEATWTAEERPRLLNAQQCAQVSFAAYKALCVLTGKHERSAVEWANMSEDVRLQFAKDGPRHANELEMRLHVNIMSILKKYS